MALVEQSIGDLNDRLSSIKTSRSKIESMQSNYNLLKQDVNYQIFVNGTDRGKLLNDNLEQLFDLIIELDSDQIDGLYKSCSVFSRTQEQLNK